MLKSVAAAGLGAPFLCAFGAESGRRDARLHALTAKYLETLSRPDGGYAWPDQEESHLTPTFAAIGCMRLLGMRPPEAANLSRFVQTHHPSHLKKLEQERRGFTFQQVQSLVWLDEDATDFIDQVRSWRRPLPYLKQYEQHGYPVFQSELGAIICRALLKLPVDDLEPEFVEYVSARRRTNGSFNNTPAADGGDGNVMNTLWGLQALAALGRVGELKEPTIAWVRQCQGAAGGFRCSPAPEFGAVEDVVYTWAAVRALKLLGAAPHHIERCVAFLASLANDDGGFAPRPGWESNPLATYHALDALAALGALDRPIPRRALPKRAPLSDNLKVFTIQIEAHGQGSPSDAVTLARALKIDLWGAKNAKPGWIAKAQAIADQQGVPVTFFVANEEYGTWVNVPGLGTYSHTSDVIAPAGVDFGLSLANKGVVSWPAFRQRRVAPLNQAGGRLVWQFGENEELVRMFLDDSLERGGFAAISTFHFGNPDFTNTEPFLNCYRGKIPFIALQDAHGADPWWFADMTTGFRTLFLATAPTWEGWLEALHRNWVVAVRHDPLSRSKTWMRGGSLEVLEFVRSREPVWRWWDNPGLERPWLSIVAVKPDDEFETARPEKGVTLRIRCAWENTAQGLPKRPLAELAGLRVDGVEVRPAEERTRRSNNTLLDHYHHFHMPDPAPGRHTAEAEARLLETGVRVVVKLVFDS
jgi:prenyltransferase beta subunit